MNNSFFAGVDIGAVSSKAIILKGNTIIGRSLIHTSVSSEKSGLAALSKALEAAGITRSDLKYIVATGYGRISVPFADKTITEITCHARGAYSLNPGVRTIVDMGGQDCKAIRLDDRGNVVEFCMNDKCASGTGRFLEVMARVFELTLDQIGPLSLKGTGRVPISSTCTVFAESEVISLMSRGETPENILSSVHFAIAQRVEGLLSRIDIEKDVFFSGGVARNAGMVKALEETLAMPVVTTEGAQLVGALGAAILAKERGEVDNQDA